MFASMMQNAFQLAFFAWSTVSLSIFDHLFLILNLCYHIDENRLKFLESLCRLVVV